MVKNRPTSYKAKDYDSGISRISASVLCALYVECAISTTMNQTVGGAIFLNSALNTQQQQ
jgi:hypothetical protein